MRSSSVAGLRPDNERAVWSETPEQVLRDLAVDPTRGLDHSEATRRRAMFGPNELRATQQRHLLEIIRNQFASIVVVLLAAAGVLTLLFADFAEAAAIFAVLAINATIGFFSEWRAARSMEALRRFAQQSCALLRAGTVRHVVAAELVPGDIVVLDAGDLVPADLRLIEAAKLTVNESTLTGESLPVRKQTGLLPAGASVLERHNMAFKGTAVVRGTGRGVVVNTGMRTVFGRIFEQVSTAEPQRTPLEKRLDALGKRLAWAVIVVGALIAIGGIFAGREILLAIQVAVALCVAAIPEGLPIVATIALARGMWHMARRNALITRLSAVETLGATSVILTDKTGTLTENRMTVTSVLLADRELALGEPAEPGAAAMLDAVLTTAVFCNNALLQPTTVAGEPEIGDPTELALLHAAADRGIRREALLQQSPEVLEDAFDPDSKRMATVHRYKGEYLTAVKGAPEIILSSCTSVLTEHGVAALDARELQRWLSRVRQLCETGRRAIAIATKISATQQTDHYADLTLQGVLGLEDPARDGVADAISRCRDAGVRVVMVTGDHADTAKNIAAQIGIVDAALGNDQFLDGRAVDSLVGSGGQEALRAARVFSRVTPEQKMQLIDLYQQGAHVVAMTGDGVNDAPALKKADIGIAMGLRGTAVARQAAAMVLQDDEFATIVAAIGQGRTIFENIRKFVVYLMSCNSSEVLVVSLATVAGAPLPLLPLQILYLNLVTDVFPALALGVGPGRHAAMLAAPRPASEPILTRNHWIEIGLYGLVMAVVVLAAMATARFWLRLDGSTVVTVSFCTLALAQMWHVFNMRADLGQIANNEIGRNVWIWVALALCSMLVLAAIYVPLLRDIMQLSNPGRSGWLLIVLASLVPLAVAPLVRRIALWPKWG